MRRHVSTWTQERIADRAEELATLMADNPTGGHRWRLFLKPWFWREGRRLVRDLWSMSEDEGREFMRVWDESLTAKRATS